jgi:2'-5' RNA ligase
MRLFVALTLPDIVADRLMLLQGGVPGARWQSREQMHLTVRFIGEVDGARMRDIDDALSSVQAPRFMLEIKGVGEFGGRNPHALIALAAASEPLQHLNRKVETALQRIGLEAETRKYTPHVTLARLRGTSRGRVIDYLTDHALFASGPFEVNGFILYSSLLTSDGSKYRAERAYQLR